MESTADAQLDFSAFLSATGAAARTEPDAGSEDVFGMLRGWKCHAREAPREDQLLVETRFSCLLVTRLKMTTSLHCDDANVEDGKECVAWVQLCRAVQQPESCCGRPKRSFKEADSRNDSKA